MKKNINFNLVITNRDHLKVNGDKIPIWEFIDRPLKHKLTSLFYCPPMKQIPGDIFFDCGAWSYRDSKYPKYTVDECLNEYAKYAKPKDTLCSPDHMVLNNEHDYRIDITLNNAKEFITKCPKGYIPIAATHGNDMETRKRMTCELLSMGYKKLAVGGVAGRAGRLSTSKGITKNAQFVIDIIETMIKEGAKDIHILGVGSIPWVLKYLEYPEVKSYDTATMYKQAFTAGTYYFVNEDDPKNILKFKAVREQNAENDLPECDCLACVSMREQNRDTRTYGSNENNMGRACHNVNMYLRTLELLGIDWGK